MFENTTWNKSLFLSENIGRSVSIINTPYSNEHGISHATLVGVKFGTDGDPDIILETGIHHVDGGILLLKANDCILQLHNLWNINDFQAKDVARIVMGDSGLYTEGVNFLEVGFNTPNLHEDIIAVDVTNNVKTICQIQIDRVDYEIVLMQDRVNLHITSQLQTHAYDYLKLANYALPYMGTSIMDLEFYNWIEVDHKLDLDEDLPF